MPDPQVQTAVELAKRVGTYGEDDRTAQYQGRYSTDSLLKNDNLIFCRLRQAENERFRHRVVLGILALLQTIAGAPYIFAFLRHLFR
jgi:hypothetical protein